MEENQRPKRARTAAATAASKAAAAVTTASKSAASKKPKTTKAATPAPAAAPSAAPAASKAKPAPAAAAAKPTAATKPAAAAVAKKRSGPLEVGEVAPPFAVKDQDGTEVTLESFKGKNVVVFFYPKDNTPGCTKEACKFRDLKDEFEALDCVVLGVSADHAISHGKFIAKFNLNFSLLADTGRELIKAYGASKPGDKIQRSTVLVDKEGKVAGVWNPVSLAEQHPVQVLAKLKEIV